MKNLPIFLILLLALSACQERIPLPQPEPQLKPINEIGKKWTYEYYTTDSTQTQTMIVEVIGDTIMDNGELATVWRFSTALHISERMVQIEQDTFKLFTDLRDYPDQIIPMNRSVNSTWLGSYCTDTSAVLSQGPYQIGNLSINEAWHIERKAGFCVNWYRIDDIWWSDQHGFLRFSSEDWTLGRSTYTNWRLVEVN